jgi:hypothetical protein
MPTLLRQLCSGGPFDYYTRVPLKARLMPHVAVRDDYQSVALSYADWSKRPSDSKVEGCNDHLTALEDLV